MTDKFLKRIVVILGIVTTIGTFAIAAFKLGLKPALLEAKVDNMAVEQGALKKSVAENHDFRVAQGEINKNLLAGQDRIEKKLDRALFQR